MKVAQDRSVAELRSGNLLSLPAITQTRGLDSQYRRNADFGGRVAGEFLATLLSPEDLAELRVSGVDLTALV